MIRKLVSFFMLMLSIISFSQEFSLKCYVKDSNNYPIAYVNAILVDLENPDSVLGTTTNDSGMFLLENIKGGNYTLKVSYLGYKTYISEIEINKDLVFDKITLTEDLQELDGITLVAKKPTIKRLVDRTVFNVENSTLSNNNVLDVLKYAPGVLISNDKINVKNKTPIVYFNDRRVYLSSEEVMQLLEGTSATNIKSIEIITNPPAKYDAEGGAVLNIVTNKNIIAGYNGSVFGNFKQGSEFPKYSLGTSHFFKTKKLNTQINYNISPRKDFVNKNEFINFINEDDLVFSSWKTDYKESKESINQNINANFDYEINKKNNIGVSANILLKPRMNSKTKTNSETLVFGNNKALDSTFNTYNRLVEETFNLAFSIDYLHKFDKEGEQIRASWHHTNYDFSNFQDVNTGYFLPNIDVSFRNNKFQTFSSQKIKIYTSQIDYELAIDDSSLFEAGVKISDIKSESILKQFAFENDIKKENASDSDTFLYDETNYAGYLSYTKEWESWSLKSGVRTEYTNVKGESLLGNQINNNKYFKLFPSIHLSNTINDSNELYFNYNRSIYRPSYSQLNPFKYFFSDNTFVTGDPNLKPQIDDEIILGYTLFKDHTFEVYYRNESNPILLVVFQDNDNNLVKYVNTNIDRSVSYGMYYGFNLKAFNNWDMSLYSSFFYYDNQFKAIESDGRVFTSNKWTTYLQITNFISFLKDKSLNADISYVYISPWAEGPSIVGTRSSLDISVKKTLWNNRASISIGVVDAFNNYNFIETSKYLNQDVQIKHIKETRLFTLGFSYKFGNFRLSTNEKDVDIQERNRINNKN